jgi:hypothetical protein
VLTYYDYRHDGGPDFSDAPFQPYRISEQRLTFPAANGRMWEIPISVGFNRPDFRRSALWHGRVRHPRLRRLHVPGILDRLGILRRIKFSPEQADSARLNKLADMYVANGAPCVVMLLHSSSLMPGCSPYVKDEAGLERFYSTLRKTFCYCRDTLGMPSATLSSFAQDLNAARPVV